MKVIHVINSIDNNTGGPARSVTHLISKILNLFKHIYIDLATKETSNPIIRSFDSGKGGIAFFIKKIKYKETYDIYHAHGIWQKSIHQMVKEAKNKNKPYIITVRGTLEKWSLKQSWFKKKIALMFYQYKDLRDANCLHATSEMEVISLRELGLKNPIAMIPNGVNISDFPKDIPIKSSKKKKILFLSRIHQKKGLENLIMAWLQLENETKKDWIIEIVGNGEGKYIEKLNQIIINNNLLDQIFIFPAVYGKNKIKLYREANLFVLPTFSENFGIVIAEALASYTPVLSTKGSPWKDLEIYNCGWWIEIGVTPLQIALEKAILTSEQELIKMGKNGRVLIEEKYSIDSVAKKMIELYNWILFKREKPNFINTK